MAEVNERAAHPASALAEPERLPIEDLEAGLYLWPHTTPVTTITRGEQTEYLVDAHAFMEMQRERDNYRRVLALINAWRISPERSERSLRHLLAGVGFSDADARAMAEIISVFGVSA
jgi:hypothetical protein